MSNLLKKLIFSSLAALALLFSLTPYLTVKAQGGPTGTWYNSSFPEWYGKVYDEGTSPNNEIFGERYAAAQVQWVFYSLVSLVINAQVGQEGTKALACIMARGAPACTTEIIDALTSASPIETKSTTLAAAFSSNKMSGVGYIKQKIDNFHLIPEAKAQGVGFTAANPIQKLWSAIRNLTFGLVVLVVIVMAFMIMFRVKISPQAVITVQSAIPKVIITLILITFSYAIAGFAIDLMYVVIGFLSTFLSSSEISTLGAAELFEYINTTNVLSLIMKYLKYFTMGVTVALFSSGGFLGVVGGVVSVLFMQLIQLVISIVLFISIFKILWLLLKAFVNVLLQIAFGPILILLGAVSSSGGFGTWLKNLAAELAVFPTVSFLFAMSFFFLAQVYSEFSNGWLGGWITDTFFQDFPFSINFDVLGSESSWSPPMTFGTDGLPLLWLGASFAVLALIPKTADIIKGLISGKPFAYGTAVGEALGPGVAVGTGAINYGMGREQAAYAKIQKDYLEGNITNVPRGTQLLHDVTNFIRGASGGKVGGKM